MSNTFDPESVEIPPNKARVDYNWRERRAALFDIVLRAGGPHRIPKQTELAKEFGCNQSQISRDLDALAEHIEKHAGKDILTKTVAAYDRIFDALMSAGEYEKAWRVHEGYSRLLERRGTIEKAPDRHEVLHGEVVDTETDDYVIIEDESSIESDAPQLTAGDVRADEAEADGEPADDD